MIAQPQAEDQARGGQPGPTALSRGRRLAPTPRQPQNSYDGQCVQRVDLGDDRLAPETRRRGPEQPRGQGGHALHALGKISEGAPRQIGQQRDGQRSAARREQSSRPRPARRRRAGSPCAAAIDRWDNPEDGGCRASGRRPAGRRHPRRRAPRSAPARRCGDRGSGRGRRRGVAGQRFKPSALTRAAHGPGAFLSVKASYASPGAGTPFKHVAGYRPR